MDKQSHRKRGRPSSGEDRVRKNLYLLKNVVEDAESKVEPKNPKLASFGKVLEDAFVKMHGKKK